MKIDRDTFFEVMDGSQYSPKELGYLFSRIVKMNALSRKWLIDWMMGKGLPTQKVEGLSVEDLVTEQNMKPLNAFLSIDWLMENPSAAKYYLTRPTSNLEVNIDGLSEKVKKSEKNDFDDAEASQEFLVGDDEDD